MLPNTKEIMERITRLERDVKFLQHFSLTKEEAVALKEFIEEFSLPESFEDAWKNMSASEYNPDTLFYKTLVSALTKLGLLKG